MRTFNSRLFLWLLAAVVVLGATVFGVHWLQTGRIARALLWHADRAEEQGRLDQTARYLSRYLEFAPADAEQRANLGRVLADQVLAAENDGKPPVPEKVRHQALFNLEQALTRFPERQDLRLRLARVALTVGQPELTLEHLKQLPEDGETAVLLGRCLLAQNKPAEAAAAYWKAVQLAPQERDSYLRLAALLRRPEAADWQLPVKEPVQVLDLLVAKNETSFEAHLARWRARPEADLRDRAKFDEAAKDVTEAQRLAPDEADVLLAAAELARREARLDGADKEACRERAQGYLAKGLQLHPKEPRLYLAQADLELAAGKPEEAVAALERGLKVVPSPTDLHWLLANLLLDHGRDGNNLARARAVIAEMVKAKALPSAVDYLQARVLVLSGKWDEAVRLLDATRPVMEREKAVPGLLDQVDLYLAECCAQLDDPARRLAAFDRVIAREEKRDRASPFLAEALQGKAQALWAAGRMDDAIAIARQRQELPGAPASGWGEIARLVIARNMARGQPGAKEVEEALKQAGKAQPDALDVPLLQARVLVAQKKWKEAEELLERLKMDNPKRIEPWIGLASLYDLRKEHDKALEVLKEADGYLSDSVELRLANAHCLAHRPGEDTAKALDLLAEPPRPAIPDWDEALLLRGMAEANYRAGRIAEAERLWGEFAALPQYQNDLRIRLAHFDLALQANDEAGMKQALAEVERLEGGRGPLWSYSEALRLMRQAKDGDEAPLAEAQTLLEKVATRRPAWPAVHVARGELARRKNEPERSIVHYQEAVKLGDRSPRTVRALVQLLHERGRSQEAEETVRKLPRQALLDHELQRLTVELALKNQDPAEALRRAMDAVPADSQDYRDFLLLGQAQAADGKSDEAAKSLRRAVELGGDAPETWVQLVRTLAAADQKEEAERVLAEARTRLPKDKQPLVLAQGYEALGRPEEALKLYQQVLAEQPGDVAALLAMTDLLLRLGRAREAEAPLRRVVGGEVKASADHLTWARCNLALVLAAKGDRPHLTEALQFVGLALAADSGEVKETAAAGGALLLLRARAKVLATMPTHACRAAAVEILEGLAKRPPLAAEDQFLLARLYEAEGTLPKAREQLRDLVTAHGKEPMYLGAYARLLLRQGEPAEAQRAVERLAAVEKDRKLEPGALGSVELAAEVLEARGQGEQAIALLRAHVRRSGARPDEGLLLIACLARQKQYQEALDLCDAAWETCSPEAVGGLAMAVLRDARPKPAEFARVQRRLEAADKAGKRPVSFALYHAELHELRGDYPQAEKLYRQVLQRDADNLIALNNLAWLLAQTAGNGDEALRLIERAIAVHGERAELLDTRAVVHLARRQSGPAIKDLEKANADARSAARYFRLAQAYQMANERDNAVKALREAKSAGLTAERLHPLEQIAFRKVADELEQK